MYLDYFVIYLFFVNILCTVTGAAANVKTTSQGTACQARVAACEANGPKRPVCGTDGKTYPSRCHLLRAQCAEPVNIAHKGPCLDGRSPCLLALRYAQGAAGRAPFVPRCRSDGTYAAVQCAAPSCWCVTPDGKPLRDTAVRNARPDCTRTGKSHTRRRSSMRGQRNRRMCSRTDRALFNGNLMKIFGGEYERARPGGAPQPRAVADWKFAELDRDGSGGLHRAEYRGLRRLVRKVVKPKRCARAWARGCDADGDGDISRGEWAACLLAAPAAPPAPAAAPAPAAPPAAADYEDSAPEPEADYNEEYSPPDPSAVLPGIMRNSFAPDGPDAESRREEDANDCFTDRQAALDEQKAGGAVLYVPECTGDGRYARAQCYRSTGYCWCVHQDTGKPIPGSSVKDRRPDCDAAPRHASPIRGCPEKTKFLRDLRSYFVSKMTSTINGTGPGELAEWGASPEERAATWAFVVLDEDKDKVLRRREWGALRRLAAGGGAGAGGAGGAGGGQRRCGRELPRHCDVNRDARISITEWLACLDVAAAAAPPPPRTSVARTTETSKPPSNPRRKGPNPLESILKADD